MKKIISVVLSLVLLVSSIGFTFNAYAATPKATSITSISAGTKSFTVKWKKVSSPNRGYQIQYATNGKFSNKKTITISKNSTVSKTVKNLKAKQKYYVKVRTYTVNNGNKKFSAWTKCRTVTTKGSASSTARTVYVTRTGKRYHYDSHCNGGTYIKSTLAEAKKRGLTPCNKCVL